MIHRIHVVGPSGSGKSTVGARLAAASGVPHVELDAINWLPGWEERDHDDFCARVAEITATDGWVVSGNYTSRGIQDLLWARAELVVWLDLPLRVTIPCQLARSWRRWRTREQLWGTNIERFWPQLAIWDPARSLVGYSIRARSRQRRQFATAMADPDQSPARWIQPTSQAEVDRFLASMPAPMGTARMSTGEDT